VFPKLLINFQASLRLWTTQGAQRSNKQFIARVRIRLVVLAMDSSSKHTWPSLLFRHDDKN